MQDIPNISFSKTEKAVIEFEIFSLNSLFSRQNKLKFSLKKPHRVNFYHILFITKGAGVHYIDFKPYNYSEGSILFIAKEQVHAFEIQPENDGFLLLFTESFISKNLVHSDVLFLHRLYNYHLQTPVMQPDEIGQSNFDSVISEIYEEYNLSDDFAKEEILRLLLKLFLLKAERIKHTQLPKEKNSDWFIKFGFFKRLLEEKISETRNAKLYADMMNISYKHLNDICKSVAGNTAKKIIDNYVILEIKRHLAISDSSVKELTYKLGFDEPTNFVKFFKKHTGHSPSQFKTILKK